MRISDWSSDVCSSDLFRLWFDQAGTPEVAVAWHYDAAAQVYELTLAQTTPPTPGQPEKAPLHIPFAVGLLDRKGREIPLRLEGEPLEDATAHRVLSLRAAAETFRFVEVLEAPVTSLGRKTDVGGERAAGSV